MLKFRFFATAILLASARLGAFQLPAPEPPDPPEPPAPPAAFALLAGGISSQSFLGVGVAEINSNRARELKLKEEHGVEITRVEDDSAAAKAGLKVGDVVLDYNGQRVEGMAQFIRLVRETPAGRDVKLLISRNGSTQTVAVVMGTQKNKLLLGRNGDWPDMPQVPNIRMQMPDFPRVFTIWSNGALGVEAEALTPQLGEFFGAKQGVLVRSVVKDSAAEKAGIKAGDVIVKVDQTSVATPAAVTSAVHSAHSKTFPVELIRDHRPLTVSVTMEGEELQQELLKNQLFQGRTVRM